MCCRRSRLGNSRGRTNGRQSAAVGSQPVNRNCAARGAVFRQNKIDVLGAFGQRGPRQEG